MNWANGLHCSPAFQLLSPCFHSIITVVENMPELQRIIRAAMDDWESKTCIKFVPRMDEEKENDYVTFFRGSQ